MFVEFMGAPGSGKTTLAASLIPLLKNKCFVPLSKNEAILRVLERSRLGRIAYRCIPSTFLRRRILGAIYMRIIFVCLKYSYVFSYYKFHISLYVFHRRLKIPKWHKKKIRRHYFDVIVGYNFLKKRLLNNEVVIYDEGVLQRAINLHAWKEDLTGNHELDYYFNQIPVIGYTVIVYASTDSCMQRLKSRGLPPVMQYLSPKKLKQFVEHSGIITESAAQFLALHNRQFLWIDNEGFKESAVQILNQGVEDFLSSHCNES